MRLEFSIQSFSDVITNSSSKIFCLKMDKMYKGLIEKTGIRFIEFKTEEEIREFVTSGWNELEDIVDWNLYYSKRFLIENLEDHGKTSDEIWEFFKFFYMGLLGHVCVSRDSWEKSMIKNYLKIIKIKQNERL